MSWSVFVPKPPIVHRLSSFLVIPAVATHRAAEEHVMSVGQDQGRFHQSYTGHVPLVGDLDLVHSQDLGGTAAGGTAAGGTAARAPSLSRYLSRRVGAQVQGDESEYDRAYILLLFLMVLWSRWSFTCHGRAHKVGAQEGTYTMTVRTNRGVEVALETTTVVGFSNLVNVVEAEIVRLSLSLHPPLLCQDRRWLLRFRSLCPQ
jgi:hypothetical protein